MSTATTTVSTAAGRPRLRRSRRVDLVTVALGTWLLVGVFVDGWAHNNLRKLETFFTPWHALLYSGFAAVGGWILWQLRPAFRDGRLDRTAVPLGYGLGAVGAGVFAVGGAADAVWHEIFGVEQNIQALFSPTHLTLFVGTALIMSTPLRAAWADPRRDTAPRYWRFLPVISSVTMTAAMTAFFFMYWAAFNHADATSAAMALAAENHLTGFYIQNVLASILVTTLVLLAPLLLLARRWQLPLGTATTMFAVVGILTNALSAFHNPALILAAVLAGLASDVVLALLRPAAHRPRRFWGAGALIPLVTWSIYYAVLVATAGVGLAAPVWTGSILWAVLAGATLALLMVPPTAPVGGCAQERPANEGQAGEAR